MIMEARGEILALQSQNMFLQVNPSFIRKKRAVQSVERASNNKFPSSSEFALLQSKENEVEGPYQKPEE